MLEVFSNFHLWGVGIHNCPLPLTFIKAFAVGSLRDGLLRHSQIEIVVFYFWLLNTKAGQIVK